MDVIEGGEEGEYAWVEVVRQYFDLRVYHGDASSFHCWKRGKCFQPFFLRVLPN